MKICLTSQGKDLSSQIDPRFGRSKYFIVFDLETDKYEVDTNENIGGTGGVGVQSGQFMASKEVDTVLTGNVGPNAYETLKAAGIKIVSGVSGTVKDAISDYKEGKYSETETPTSEAHSGMQK